MFPCLSACGRWTSSRYTTWVVSCQAAFAPLPFFLHCCTLGRNALQGEQKGLVKHPARRETHKLPISHFEWRIFGTPQGCSLSPLLFCYLGLLFVTNQASYTSLSANKPKVNSEVCLKAISCRGLVKNNIKLLLLVLVLNFLVLKKKTLNFWLGKFWLNKLFSGSFTTWSKDRTHNCVNAQAESRIRLY